MGGDARAIGSFIVVCAIAQAATFCSLTQPDVEGTPLPSRAQRPEREGESESDDPSAPAPSGTPPPNGGVDASAPDGATPGKTGPLVVFVSSEVKTGNLGGVAGADALCIQLGKAANIPGVTFRAWISTPTTNAIDRIKGTGPFKLVDGTVIAQDRTELASGKLRHGLDKDEKGATPPLAEDRVWTATGADGKYAGGDCAQWTGGQSGRVGEAEQASDAWTTLVDEACTEVNRVYCFAQ
jgi:hypothetical protein